MRDKGTFLSVGSVMLVLALAGCPDRSTHSGATAGPAGGEHNQVVSEVNRYSKSGYDLTPLSKEEIDAIVATLTPEQVRTVVEPAGFAFAKLVELPPYHYGVVFRISARKPEDRMMNHTKEQERP